MRLSKLLAVSALLQTVIFWSMSSTFAAPLVPEPTRRAADTTFTPIEVVPSVPSPLNRSTSDSTLRTPGENPSVKQTQDFLEDLKIKELKGLGAAAEAKFVEDNSSNSKALIRYGQLLESRGEKVNAVKLFQKAASLGDAQGVKYLGDMYLWGSGVQKSEAKALELYESAKTLSGGWGYLGLGKYQLGKQRISEGIANLQKAIEDGCVPAFSVLADLKYGGDWYSQTLTGAQAGDRVCQYRLGLLYKNGFFWKIDPNTWRLSGYEISKKHYPTAVYWMKLSDEKFFEVHSLADEFVNLKIEIPVEQTWNKKQPVNIVWNDMSAIPNDTIERLRRKEQTVWKNLAVLAEKGNSEAAYLQYIFCSSYDDYFEASKLISLLKKAAGKGHLDAQFALLQLDAAEAVKKSPSDFKKLADQGHLEAQKWIALKEKDWVVLERTAKAGLPGSQMMMVLNSQLSEEERLNWLEIAAENGDLVAQKALGSLYYSIAIGADPEKIFCEEVFQDKGAARVATIASQLEENVPGMKGNGNGLSPKAILAARLLVEAGGHRDVQKLCQTLRRRYDKYCLSSRNYADFSSEYLQRAARSGGSSPCRSYAYLLAARNQTREAQFWFWMAAKRQRNHGFDYVKSGLFNLQDNLEIMKNDELFTRAIQKKFLPDTQRCLEALPYRLLRTPYDWQ